MPLFTTGDWAELFGQRVEITYWPESDDGMAVFTQHRANGGSTITTDHTSKIIPNAKLIEHGDHPPLPSLDPSIPNALTPESTPAAKKASAKSDE
jgi:hypothetical protein